MRSNSEINAAAPAPRRSNGKPRSSEFIPAAQWQDALTRPENRPYVGAAAGLLFVVGASWMYLSGPSKQAAANGTAIVNHVAPNQFATNSTSGPTNTPTEKASLPVVSSPIQVTSAVSTPTKLVRTTAAPEKMVALHYDFANSREGTTTLLDDLKHSGDENSVYKKTMRRCFRTTTSRSALASLSRSSMRAADVSPPLENVSLMTVRSIKTTARSG